MYSWHISYLISNKLDFESYNQDQQNSLDLQNLCYFEATFMLHLLNFSVHGSNTGIKRNFSDIEGQKLQK